MVDVREAVESDRPELTRLWMRFMAEESQAVPQADVGKASEGWSERLRAAIERQHVYLVDSDGQVQGFAMWIDSAEKPWIPAGVAYIVDIYMIPDGRKGRAAATLLKSLLTAMRDLRYKQVWTNTHTGNHRARVLLDRSGFAEISDFEIPGLTDQIYLKMDLA